MPVLFSAVDVTTSLFSNLWESYLKNAICLLRDCGRNNCYLSIVWKWQVIKCSNPTQSSFLDLSQNRRLYSAIIVERLFFVWLCQSLFEPLILKSKESYSSSSPWMWVTTDVGFWQSGTSAQNTSDPPSVCELGCGAAGWLVHPCHSVWPLTWPRSGQADLVSSWLKWLISVRIDSQARPMGVKTGILLEASRKSCCPCATVTKPATAGGHLCHHLEKSRSEPL